MVKHIVMFKLSENNPENLEKAVTLLKGMVGKIETLQHLEVGVDFKQSPRSYDIVLITGFDDRGGLEVYSNHPVHQPVKETLLSMCSSTIVVDYETQ